MAFMRVIVTRRNSKVQPSQCMRLFEEEHHTQITRVRYRCTCIVKVSLNLRFHPSSALCFLSLDLFDQFSRISFVITAFQQGCLSVSICYSFCTFFTVSDDHNDHKDAHLRTNRLKCGEIMCK